MTNQNLKYEDLIIYQDYWILQVDKTYDNEILELYLFQSELKRKYLTTEYDIYGDGSTEKELEVADFGQLTFNYEQVVDLHFVLNKNELTNCNWNDMNGYFFKEKKDAIEFITQLNKTEN
jgi:hypothetical protein